MTSPTHAHTNLGCVFIRPFDQVADSKYGGYPPFIGLCHDICTAFPTTPAGHPHPPPPGMGKADRLGQRVPLPPPHFNPTQNPLRQHNVAQSVSHPGNAPTVPLFPPRFTPTEDPLRVSNVA
jgi:hypothetical protein